MIPTGCKDGDSPRVRGSCGNGVSRCPRTHPEEQVEEEEHVLGHRAHEREIVPEGPGGGRRPPRHGRAGPSGAERYRAEPNGAERDRSPLRPSASTAEPSPAPSISRPLIGWSRLTLPSYWSIAPSLNPRGSRPPARCGAAAPVRALKGQRTPSRSRAEPGIGPKPRLGDPPPRPKLPQRTPEPRGIAGFYSYGYSS